MTNLNPKPARTGTPRRGTPWRPPAVPSPRHRRPLRLSPARSLRLPVTPENRDTLRAMRAAEMQAWQTSPNSSPDAIASPLQSPAVKTRLRGLPITAVAMALAALALGAAVMLSLHLAWRWMDLLVLIRQWLG
ncbi:MAG: hypothetical protein KIS67_16510 [Verrucomicrobiae bacterium]|nr:hypothetical protein [Verrucomicrobiae bacterium]